MRSLLGRVPLLVWFLLPTFIIVGVGVWFLGRGGAINGGNKDSTKPEAVSRPVQGTVDYTIVSRTHIAEGTTGSGYNSNPSSSGPHWPSPAQKGIYDTAEADQRYIHNLEHGYIWISYRPPNDTQSATNSAGLKSGASQDDINKLKDIVKQDDWKIVMTPRDKDDAKIALAAWGRVLNMDSLDEQKVKDFIRTYRNRGPERTPE